MERDSRGPPGVPPRKACVIEGARDCERPHAALKATYRSMSPRTLAEVTQKALSGVSSGAGFRPFARRDDAGAAAAPVAPKGLPERARHP